MDKKPNDPIMAVYEHESYNNKPKEKVPYNPREMCEFKVGIISNGYTAYDLVDFLKEKGIDASLVKSCYDAPSIMIHESIVPVDEE